MLKAELHTHTSADPADAIPYDAFRLIDRAADWGYRVLAITLHDKQFDIQEAAGHARDRGVVLIRGIERTISGKHVLLLNFPDAAERVASFDDVRALKVRWPNGLVIAPHPFFPLPSCLGDELDRHADLWDAVEVNAFYTRSIDFNSRAIAWAEAHGLPLVGNGDVHRLEQLGTTFSIVDAEPHSDAVVEAIRERRVQVETTPIPAARALSILASMTIADIRSTLTDLAGYGRRTRFANSTASQPHTSPIAAPPSTSNG